MKFRQIYALVDPRDKTAKYVGISKDASSRLNQHMREIQNDKRAWLAELKQLGLAPEIAILEIIDERPDTDAMALERERHWIHQFLRSGAPLTNIVNTSLVEEKPKESTVELSPDTCVQNKAFNKALQDARLTAKQLSIEAIVQLSDIEKIEHDEPVGVSVALRIYRNLRSRIGRSFTYQSLRIKTR